MPCRQTFGVQTLHVRNRCHQWWDQWGNCFLFHFSVFFAFRQPFSTLLVPYDQRTPFPLVLLVHTVVVIGLGRRVPLILFEQQQRIIHHRQWTIHWFWRHHRKPSFNLFLSLFLLLFHSDIVPGIFRCYFGLFPHFGGLVLHLLSFFVSVGSSFDFMCSNSGFFTDLHQGLRQSRLPQLNAAARPLHGHRMCQSNQIHGNSMFFGIAQMQRITSSGGQR